MLKYLAKSLHCDNFQLMPGLAKDNITRLWLMSFLFLMAISLAIVPAFYFDSRLLDGVSFWSKPLKFSTSMAIHFITLAVLAQQLDRTIRTGKILSIVGYAAVASMLFEQIYITIQAARGRRSHFNFDTEFEIGMYQLMGIGATLLILASLVLGLMIWRYGKRENMGLWLGSIFGLILGSILTGYFAGYIATYTSHLVVSGIDDSTGLPVVGWSRQTGDLRIPHFVATHMMQIIPAVGLLADKAKWPPKTVVIGTSLILTIVCFVLLELALSGQPLLPL